MKSRLFYYLISGILILSVFTGFFIWRNKQVKHIPKFNGQSFNAPVSSKYIPTNTDLIFHWKINPTIMPSYIKNYQDKASKNAIDQKISFIRDSSFKLISLDFAKDISKWVGDYGSFAIYESNTQAVNNWILVLGIKEDVKIEDELESILFSNFIDKGNKSNNEINKSKIEIFSKQINSNKSIFFANDKNNLLIASNPKIIESSIENLDRNILNTKKKYKNIQLKDNLDDGFLLLELAPKKILNIIGQEDNLFNINEIDNLISSINLNENNLNIEGIISYDNKTKMPVKHINYDLNYIKKESEFSRDWILVDNPNQYFSKDSIHPYKKLIKSIIIESITSNYSELLEIIFQNSKGNLIWIDNKGWLVLTRKSDIQKAKISEMLTKENFLISNLDFQNMNLEVLSKISTDENEKYQLKENIEAIIKEDKDTYILSQNLSAISNLDNATFLKNYPDNEHNIDEFSDFDDVLRIHLEGGKAETILNNFYPYILFKAMLSNKLNPPQNIDISVAVPTINYPDFIKVKINLKTS